MLNEDLILEMYNYAIDYLAASGYTHYEISNFAMPGFQCIHNLNYWNRGEYIGAGAGAHSFVGDTRSVNTTDINEYTTQMKRGHIPSVQSVKVTHDDSLKEFIFLGLRKTEGINMGTMDAVLLEKERLSRAAGELIAEGYLDVSGDFLRLTQKGIVISNTIIVRLFQKLGL